MLFQLLYSTCSSGSNSTPILMFLNKIWLVFATCILNTQKHPNSSMVEHSLATEKIWVRIPIWITCICVVTICRDWHILENDSQNKI